MAFRLIKVGRIATRSDLADQAQRIRLVAALTSGASQQYGAVGAGAGIVDLVREQIRLAESRDAERVVEPDT